MKYILVPLALLAVCTADAAEVRWNAFHFLSDQGEGAVCGYYDAGHSSPEIGIRYFYDTTGNRLVKIDGKGENVNVGWNVGIWVLAVAGDVLGKEYFSQPHIVLRDSYNSMIDDSSYLPQPSPISVKSTGDSVEVVNGDRFYLALIGYWYKDIDSSIDPPQVPDLADFYGWIELEAGRNELSIIESAFSYSPLVVGAGAFDIPEPTGGLLVLLGFSVLALRRTRRKLV